MLLHILRHAVLSSCFQILRKMTTDFLLVPLPDLRQHHRMCVARFQSLAEERVDVLERNAFGLGDEEVNVGNRDEHECCKEEIHSVSLKLASSLGFCTIDVNI